MKYMTAEEFYQSKNGGKDSATSEEHGENFRPSYWVQLMEEYAELKNRQENASLSARLKEVEQQRDDLVEVLTYARRYLNPVSPLAAYVDQALKPSNG